MTILLKHQLRDSLATLIPDVHKQAFTLGIQERGSIRKGFARRVELQLSHGGPSLPIQKQSNGLIQLAVFVFALKVVASDPKCLLLVDEPEISLHPQAQRSLSACRKLPNEFTHCYALFQYSGSRRYAKRRAPSSVKGMVTAAQATALSDDRSGPARKVCQSSHRRSVLCT